MLYVLICVLIALAILIAPAFARKHSPTHCRCGKVAIVKDDDRPGRVWCYDCHIRQLRRRGEVQ